MSDGLQTLRSLGIQEIHDKTHITRQQIQALLHESFDDISKVHFFGFISILEREYDIDLSSFKEEGKKHYSQEHTLNLQDKKVFILPDKKKNYNKVYLSVAAFIFIFGILISLDYSSNVSEEIESPSLDDSVIKYAKENFDVAIPIVEDKNSTIEDENITALAVETESKSIDTVKSFKIKPKSKLWLGYIDLSTYKKYQGVFKKELELDPQKEWLLLFGHRNVKIEIDGKVVKSNSKSNLRFLYKDSEISKVSIKEFKKLNRGKKW